MKYHCEYCDKNIILSKSQAAQLECPNCGASLSEDKVFLAERRHRLNRIFILGLFIAFAGMIGILYLYLVQNWIYDITYEPNTSDVIDFLISDSIINLVEMKDGSYKVSRDTDVSDKILIPLDTATRVGRDHVEYIYYEQGNNNYLVKYVFGDLDSEDVFYYYYGPVSDEYKPYGWFTYNFDEDAYEIQVSETEWMKFKSDDLWHMSKGSEK